MKKITTLLSVAAVALSVQSCSYLQCLTAENPQECAAGLAIDYAVEKLVTNMSDVDTAEKAEKLASRMDTLLTAIEAAQALKMDVPESAKKAYNNALSRIQKHNYFGSSHLRTAMQNARYLN